MPANNMIEEIKSKMGELSTSVEEFKSAQGEEKAALAGKIEDMQKSLDALQDKYDRGFSVPGYEEEKQKFSFYKACKASYTGDWAEAGFEKEVSDTISKSINATEGSEGGFLAPTEEMQEIIGLARAGRPILNSVGIRMLSGLGSSALTMNKVTSGNTAYWVGQEDTLTSSDAAFGQINLKPNRLGAYTTLSRNLLKQTAVGVEALIREELAQSMTKKLEQSALYGDGLSESPLGVTQYGDINSIALGTNGAIPTWDDLDDMIHELEKDDTLEGNLSFVTSPQIAKVLRQSKIAQYTGDTGGEYYLRGFSNKGISDMLGYSFYTSTLVPTNLVKGDADNCSYIVFGDWSQMMMASWGGMEVRVSEQAQTPFLKNQVLIATEGMFDFGLRREDSFAVIKDAKIAA